MSKSAKPQSVTGSAAAQPLPSRGAITLSNILGDWKWVRAELEAGRLDAYRGQHLAVVNRAVVAAGPDPWQVRHSAAEALHLDPERVVVYFVEDEE
jgi:hypothetical protein